MESARFIETEGTQVRRPSAMTVGWLVPVFVLISNAILSTVNQPANSQILTTHVLQDVVESTLLQKISYAFLVTLLLLFCALALVRPRDRLLNGQSSPRVSATVSVLVFSILLASAYWSGDWWFAGGLLAALFVISALANFPDARARVFANSRVRVGLICLGILLLGIHIATHFVWPLLYLPTEYISAGLTHIDTHYASTVLPGYDFICCQDVGTVVRTNYGLAMPLISAFLLKFQQLLGGTVSDLLLAVRLSQLVSLALILFAVRLLGRRYFLLVSAILILVLPYLSLSADGRPNLVGIRYIPFLLGMIVLILLTKVSSPRFAIPIAAATSALLLVGNPEAGVAMTCGFAFLVALMYYRVSRPVLSILLIVTSFVLIGATFYLLASVAARQLIDPNAQLASVSSISNFLSGYGGIAVRWTPGMATLVLFAVLAVINSVLRVRSGHAAPPDVYQGAVGIVMLAWFPYYVNRQLDGNFWFEIVLVVLLWVPQLEKLDARILSTRIGSVAPYTWLAGALVGGLLASGFGGTARAVTGIASAPMPCVSPAIVIEGRCLRSPDASEIQAHLTYLSALRNKDDYLVLSHLPTAVRMLGVNEGFPWYEPFGEVSRRQDLETIASYIDTQGPKFLLLEDPATTQSRALPNLVRHQREILQRLTAYRFVGSSAGWLIYTRN